MSDVTFVINEPTFNAVFSRALVSLGKRPFDGSTSVGPLWLGVAGVIHIDDPGDIDFEDGDTFLLNELDLGWDGLILRFGIDLPTTRIGDFCVFRFPDDTPFVGGECFFEFPGVTLFEGAPDIGPLKFNLNSIIPFIVTEISGRFTIAIRPDGAFQSLYADVEAIDVDPISINDTFGKLPAILKAAIVACAAVVVSKVPQVWLIDALLGILGVPSVTQWILNLLDIGDDAEEWLMDKLNFSIGIDDLIAQAILDLVLKDTALFTLEDPFPFIPDMTALTEDFGGWPGPAPTTPQFAISKVAAGITNASAAFDEDHLSIRFDFAV